MLLPVSMQHAELPYPFTAQANGCQIVWHALVSLIMLTASWLVTTSQRPSVAMITYSSVGPKSYIVTSGKATTYRLSSLSPKALQEQPGQPSTAGTQHVHRAHAAAAARDRRAACWSAAVCWQAGMRALGSGHSSLVQSSVHRVASVC